MTSDEVDDGEDAETGPISGPSGTVSALDQQAAREAYKKVLAQEPLTSREQTALRRFEKEREEKLRWQYYVSIPQKHWRQMSGRQTKVLHEQAAAYGLPFGGPAISLPEVVRALHDFLAANARKLSSPEDDLLQAGVPSPALERYREERAALAKLDRLERENQLVSRDRVREGLGRTAALIRTAGESLEREFGAAAREILDQALDDAEQELQRTFGGQNEDTPAG